MVPTRPQTCARCPVPLDQCPLSIRVNVLSPLPASLTGHAHCHPGLRRRDGWNGGGAGPLSLGPHHHPRDLHGQRAPRARVPHQRRQRHAHPVADGGVSVARQPRPRPIGETQARPLSHRRVRHLPRDAAGSIRPGGRSWAHHRPSVCTSCPATTGTTRPVSGRCSTTPVWGPTA